MTLPGSRNLFNYFVSTFLNMYIELTKREFTVDLLKNQIKFVHEVSMHMKLIDQRNKL